MMDILIFFVLFCLVPAICGFIGGSISLPFWRWVEKRRGMYHGYFFCFLFSALLLSSCSPMFSSDLKESMKELAKDKASVCANVKGGAGAMTIGPGALPGGGGYGSMTICRSGEAGSEIEVSDASMKIKHGSSIAKDLADRVETLEISLRYLLQKLSEAVEKENATGTRIFRRSDIP